MSERKILSSNTLKTIAFISMVIDHVGLVFFPTVIAFRIVGRLAFPIFAFMISEGARYTKNRLAYFLRMLIFGILFNAVYYYFTRDTLLSIFFTFSISILTIYLLEAVKSVFFDPDSGKIKKNVYILLGFLGIVAVVLLTRVVTVDYGFFGCMLPVFASLFDFRRINAPMNVKAIDRLMFRQFSFTAGVLVLAAHYGGIQYFSLLALPLVYLYSEERGKRPMKYFFYVAYPLHIAIIYGLRMLIVYLNK